MSVHRLYYATNRNHQGKDRWRPRTYGSKFSADGMENLRFGAVEVSASDRKVAECLRARVKGCGNGDGEKLSGYLSVPPGGTTEDLLFTLESVACVGACALAPVVVVDGEVHAAQSVESAMETVDELREKSLKE